MRADTRKPRGFAAIMALVVIVLFALVSAAMLTLGTEEHVGGLLSLRAAQSYFAASAGLEWGIVRTPNCAASTTFTLEGYDVTVTCAATSVDDGTVYPLYTFTATATPTGMAAGDPLFARRQVRAVVSQP